MGAPELPVGELRASWGHEWSAPTCEICTRGANDDLTLNFSLNLAIMRYVPARLWLRTGNAPIQVQDRRGQRDPRKRPRARGAIMARPRCKPHRPFYFLWGNTASRASGPVVKVAAASRANAPVRKCGVKYQVSWWEQPDIPCRARIVYDTEGRVADMVRGSLMHATRLGAGTAEVIAVLGLSGCAFNPLSTFTTPTIDQIEHETVTPHGIGRCPGHAGNPDGRPRYFRCPASHAGCRRKPHGLCGRCRSCPRMPHGSQGRFCRCVLGRFRAQR